MVPRPPSLHEDDANPYEAPRLATEPARIDERPRWVRLGLWGLNEKWKAWVFFWLTLGVAAIGLLFGVLPGLIMLLAAAWYWGAIRWMDHHKRW